MIHIVFQEPDIQALKKSFDIDGSMQGEIIQVKDDFAVGPLQSLYSDEGIAARKQWWREVLSGGDYDGLVDNGTIDDNKTVNDLISALNASPEEVVWIWVAQNKHDVSGYYWLVSQLNDFQGRVFILYLNNLPFLNDKGNIFYPANLFQIAAKEFVKAKKLARLITSVELEGDAGEWKMLCEENREVRLLESGKKLVQRDSDFYDEELVKWIGPDWIKASKLIHAYLNKATHTTGDAYLLWRLKKLVESGRVEAQGELRNMKDFEVKLRTLEN